MKNTIAIALIICSAFAVQAQDRYFTRDGMVTFFSHTAMEDIEAVNHKLTSVIDMSSGSFEFAALMKSFEFEKALMEEHFNENYVESNTYPKATFKGKIEDFDKVLTGLKSGMADVTASGTLMIHGVEQKVSIPAKIEKIADTYKVSAVFKINPEDYGIEIPNTVRDNIAEQLEVTVDAPLAALKK